MEQRPFLAANSSCVGRSLLIIWCRPKCCEVVVSDREMQNVLSFSETAVLIFAWKDGIRSGCHPFAKHAVKLC
jgi:hypothetical protein